MSTGLSNNLNDRQIKLRHKYNSCFFFFFISPLLHPLPTHIHPSSPSSPRRARGSAGGQPLQAVAPPAGPGFPLPQMHLHMLQRPDAAAAPAEARRDQTLPVPALLLRQQPAEPARGAPSHRAQGPCEAREV